MAIPPIAVTLGLAGSSDFSVSQCVDAVLKNQEKIDAEEFLTWSGDVGALQKDLRLVYGDALEAQRKEDEEEDGIFLEKATQYQELHEQVVSSQQMLDVLEDFLSSFQNDLSNVSSHISELQKRSQHIENQLGSRRAVEEQLGPFLAGIVISPALITTILETQPGDDWIPVIEELDSKLTAIRSGARISIRKELDEAAEKVRLKASDSLRTFLISLLAPLRVSTSVNVQIHQASILLKYRSFFAFLQRHSARIAHEVQKAYIGTVRWYFETSFRRYVRGLEKVRVRSMEKRELITGSIGESGGLLARKPTMVTQAQENDKLIEGYLSRRVFSKVDGVPVTPAYQGDDVNFKQPSESLFRSVSLVLADNATSEYEFVTSFFSNPSDLDIPQRRLISSSRSNSSLGVQTENGDDDDDAASSVGDDQSVVSSSDWTRNGSVISGSDMAGAGGLGRESRKERKEKLRKSIVENVWKQIMDPAMEYARNFCAALIEPNAPSPVSILCMIRLNDEIYEELIDGGRCPAMENYLVSLRLRLWPLFQKEMNAEIDAVRKINGSVQTSGGLFGGRSSTVNVKESQVQQVCRKYAAMFNAIIGLSEEKEDDMVFSSLLRLRIEIEKLLTLQSTKQTDASAYLASSYEGMVGALSAGATSHPKSQNEVSHWRERGQRETLRRNAAI
ncbi:Vps52/Sac2 [Atractiella rhizophila]|nr:Vps52/Sac2 [Atractiella rhizophila]